MKPRLVLLYTRDQSFDRVLAETLLGRGAVVLIARCVGDAMQIVCERGRELDLVLLDFNGGCRGLTLLSAIHTCRPELPIFVTTSEDMEHVTAVAYSNGARKCLTKPVCANTLNAAISNHHEMAHQLVAA